MGLEGMVISMRPSRNAGTRYSLRKLSSTSQGQGFAQLFPRHRYEADGQQLSDFTCDFPWAARRPLIALKVWRWPRPAASWLLLRGVESIRRSIRNAIFDSSPDSSRDSGCDSGRYSGCAPVPSWARLGPNLGLTWADAFRWRKSRESSQHPPAFIGDAVALLAATRLARIGQFQQTGFDQRLQDVLPDR